MHLMYYLNEKGERVYTLKKAHGDEELRDRGRKEPRELLLPRGLSRDRRCPRPVGRASSNESRLSRSVRTSRSECVSLSSASSRACNAAVSASATCRCSAMAQQR